MTDNEIVCQLDRQVLQMKAFLTWKPEDVEVISYSLGNRPEDDYIQTYGGRLRELAEKAGVEVTEERFAPEVGGGELVATICGCKVIEVIP